MNIYSMYVTSQESHVSLFALILASSKQARSHNEANEAVASPKISKKNLPQMKNS